MNTKIPQDDEEALFWLTEGYSPDVARVLCGLYRCKRARGASVLHALESTLLDHLRIAEEAHVGG